MEIWSVSIYPSSDPSSCAQFLSSTIGQTCRTYFVCKINWRDEFNQGYVIVLVKCIIGTSKSRMLIFKFEITL